MIVVVMGVSGSGKTTVGERLAERLGWAFLEGDEFQPEANVRKMSSGVPLTDEDRRPWLERLRAAIEEREREGESAVVACSALKASYRRLLLDGVDEALLVHLYGDPELLAERLAGRPSHFFDPSLLASQLDTLEEPAGALRFDVAQPPDVIVAAVVEALA